jgi:dephospho-CoA kinase
MLRVGITGGIGSGKSTVCRIFEALAIPVFYADDVARTLQASDNSVIAAIKKVFGDDIYSAAGLDRKRLAAIVFGDPKALKILNDIVHPAVKKRFEEWVSIQRSPFVLREAAVLIESGNYHDLDAIIAVEAPEAVRMKRVMKRDGLSEPEVRERMQRQLRDEERRQHAQFVINNSGKELLLPQVLHMYQTLISHENPAH